MYLRSWRRLAQLMVLLPLSSGCTDPCEVLVERVCEVEEDEARCELMQDPERRAHLTRSTCEGILETMDER